MRKLQPGVWLVDSNLNHSAARRARNTAAAALFPARTDQALLESGASNRQSVSMLTCQPDGTVFIYQGQLGWWGGPGERLTLLKKGSLHLGFDLSGPKALPVLAWEFGEDRHDKLAALWAEHLAVVPELEPTRFDRIPEYQPLRNDTKVHAVFLIDHPGFEGGWGATTGCLFFCWDVQGEDEIANGWLWSDESSLMVNEHGSQYYRDLEQFAGRVKGFKPGKLDLPLLAEAMPSTRRAAYEWLGGFCG